MIKNIFNQQYYRNIPGMFSQVIVMILLAVILIGSCAEKKLQPGQTFRDCTECPEIVVIPAGTFTIGSPASETGRTDFEGPQVSVNIQQFAAGKFDVTKEQWAAFVKATDRIMDKGCAWSGLQDSSLNDWENNPNASWDQLGFPQDDNHPVVCITWNDAQDYVSWLSQKSGSKYRLLTESEWEYAARAGTTTAYPWGTEASHEHANYGADSGWVGLASGRDQWTHTSPVGSFPPNAFGLYDMHGNVLQYVEDCFSNAYSDLPTDGSAYTTEVQLNLEGRFSFMNGTTSCENRMVRGGDWGNPPSLIRSAFRNWVPGPGFTLQNYRSGGVGFRVAKEL